MVQIGYTMMSEQRSPQELVADVITAERAGFDFAVISDHYHPWLEVQGLSPYAWAVLGAAAQATVRIPLMTYVTTPTMRYHPVVVAQKAATVAILAEGRFRLGLGAGEQLNEHVVGRGFPAVDLRHQMLAEAVEIIRRLFTGDYVTHHGDYFDVEGAKLFDLPDVPPLIGIAASGPASCRLAGTMADLLIAVEPRAELVKMFRQSGGAGRPVVGQPAICWGPDEAACRRLAHEHFAWSLADWKVKAELPNAANFAALADLVSEEQVASHIPCGPALDPIVNAVASFAQAGFSDVALLQIGPSQAAFCDFFARELGPALRAVCSGA